MESSILELVAGGAVVATVLIFIGFLKWAVSQFRDVVEGITKAHQMGMNGLGEAIQGMKEAVNNLNETQKESNKTNRRNTVVAERAIKVSEQNYDFLRNLNGELKKAYDKKRSYYELQTNQSFRTK